MADTPDYASQGQVTLPDGGQVDAPPQTQPSPPQSATVAPPSQTVQPGPTATQPQSTQSQPGPATGQNPPPQPKPVQPQTKQPLVTNANAGQVVQDQPVHPLVARASILNQVATTLAGGPRYTYHVDPNTGDMTKTQVPLSKADIGMSIALEAISGALTGISQHGPGSAGRGGAMAFAQSEQRSQQQQQQAQAQASADFARAAMITETNMKRYQMARTVGRMDLEDQVKLWGQNKDDIDAMAIAHPNAVGAEITYQDFGKYNVTKDTALPYRIRPRIDPTTGEQAKDANGQPLYDHTYRVLNPHGEKAADWLTPDEKDILKSIGKLPKDWPSDALLADRMAFSLKATADNFKVAQTTLSNIYDTINKGQQQATYTGLKAPAIKDPAVNAAAEAAAAKYGVPVELVKGMINQESGGNPNAVNKDSGATGLMQLMPATAARYGVTDPKDINQNVDGATHYLADLLRQDAGDIRKALTTYGGFVTKDPTSYVNSITKSIGLDSAKQVPATLIAMPDLKAATAKDGILPDALAAFQGAINATIDDKTGEEQLGAALKQLQTTNPSYAASIVNYLGGTKPITDFDEAQETAREVRKANVSVQTANQKNIDKTAQDAAIANKNEQYLTVPSSFEFKPEMVNQSPEDLKASLAAQGVQIPKNFGSLYTVGKYRAPLATVFPGRVWAKGSPDEMDQQTGLSYISQFINPQFNSQNYQTSQKLRTQLVDANSRDGGAIRNSGTAVQHMQLLRQAAEALQTGRWGAFENSPAFNAAKNFYDVQTGDPAPTVFKAIAGKVNAEVEKVAAGGNVPFKDELADGKNILSASNPVAVTDAVLKSYSQLMGGRLSSIDDNAYTTLGEHLKNVPQPVTSILQRYGTDTPWASSTTSQGIQGSQGNPNAPITYKPNDTTQYQKLSPDKQWGYDTQGNAYRVATGTKYTATTPVSQ